MIESYGVTDVGLRRKLNEDSLILDNALGLFIVADGMGGHNAGEIASRLAVETVFNFVQRSGAEEEITWPYGVDPKLSLNANRLLTAVMLANKRVWKEAGQGEGHTRLGPTDRAGRGGPAPPTAGATTFSSRSASKTPGSRRGRTRGSLPPRKPTATR